MKIALTPFLRNVLAAVVAGILAFLVPTRTGWKWHNLTYFVSYCIPFGLALGIAESMDRSANRLRRWLYYFVPVFLACAVTMFRDSEFFSRSNIPFAYSSAFLIAFIGMTAVWISSTLFLCRVASNEVPPPVGLFFETMAGALPIAAVFLVRASSEGGMKAGARILLIAFAFSAARFLLPPPPEESPLDDSWFYSRLGLVEPLVRFIRSHPEFCVGAIALCLFLMSAVVPVCTATSQLISRGDTAKIAIQTGAAPDLASSASVGSGHIDVRPQWVWFTPLSRDVLEYSVPWAFSSAHFDVRLYGNGVVEIYERSIYSDDDDGPVLTGILPRDETDSIFAHFHSLDLDEYYGFYQNTDVFDGATTKLTWTLSGWSGSIEAFNIGVVPVSDAYRLLVPIGEKLYRAQGRKTPHEVQVESQQRWYEEQNRRAHE